MNQAHGTLALACENEWVAGWVFFLTPADSALNIILVLVNVLDALDLHGFSEFLFVKFVFGHLLVVATEVLNSKSDSS